MSTTPAHLGIVLMRKTDDHTLHGYGRHPETKEIDFNWQLLEVPRLPESMLTHAAGGLRYLFKTHRKHGAYLLYINQTVLDCRWFLVFPPQSCDPNGCDPRLDLQNLDIPPSARLAGVIASASMQFVESALPTLPGDGLYIVVDTVSEWLVARTTMTIGGQSEGVLLSDIIAPDFKHQEEVERNLLWRPSE